jgi:hypothetical protein
MGNRRLANLLALVLLISTSCTLLQKNLTTIPEERPVVLFDRYKLFFEAQSHGDYPTYWFYVGVSFADERSADLERIDTIPILRIDSVCFIGGCVDIEICRPAVMSRELKAAEEAAEKERTTGEKTDIIISYTNIGMGHRDYDLRKGRGSLGPESFRIVGGVRLPAECNDSTGIAILHMRLLDRTTKKVIASEARSVGFEVSTQKVWYNRPHNKE